MKKIIHTSKAPDPIGPYNQAIQFNEMLFTSGQIAIDPESGDLYTGGDIKEETEIVMKNLQAVLHAAGLDFEDVLKVTIFISDMNNFSSINEVYGSFFKDETAPARETVEVARLPRSVNVEISLIAAKKE